MDVYFNYLPRSSDGQLSLLQSLSLLGLSYCALWKEVTACSPHLGVGGMLHFLERSICIIYLKLFCVGDLSVILHLTIYSYQYGMRSIYFLLWVMVQYYFICFVAKIVSALTIGSSFRWLLCHFTVPPSLWTFFLVVSEHFLTFWYYKTLQAPLLNFLPQS